MSGFGKFEGSTRVDDSHIARAFAPKAGEVVELIGSLDSIRVVNTASGWGFGRLWSKKHKVNVPFTGIVSQLYQTAEVTLRGKWVEHERFGWQVNAQAVVVDLPTEDFGVRVWLESHFPDIGPVRATAILKTFPPAELWEVLEHTPERLEEVEGIGPVLRQQIASTYVFVKTERDVYIGLVDYGLKVEQVREAVSRWGRKTLETLQADPYRLVEIDVPFKQVDGLGLRNGIKRQDPRRIVAGHVYAMQQIEREGHTTAPIKVLQSAVAGADVLGLPIRTVLDQWPVVLERGMFKETEPNVVSLAYRAAQEREIAAFISGAIDPVGAEL